MTRETEDSEDSWYLDSCASRHICNDKRFFSDLRPKSYEFMTAGGDIIRSEEVGNVRLPTCSGLLILNNVAYTPRCNSNLISLGQLRESGITYYDHPEQMILKQGGNTIGSASRHKNLFTLDTPKTTADKAMIIQGRGRPTYLQSQNPQINLCHRRFAHASNARIVQASNLVDGINIDVNTDEKQPLSSDSETEDVESDFDEPVIINKIIDTSSETAELYDACIESKHTRIVKTKSMTPTTRRLQEIHADLWGPHDPPSLSGRNYVALLLDEFTCKSWILMLRSKDEFFDVFKL